MEARTLSIRGIIQNDTLLRIPYFQRRYVWGEDEWARFAVDMESTIENERSYFLGAVILKNEEVSHDDNKNGIGQKYLVIDGQQRLTTLAIYMKVLHMLTGKTLDFKNQYLLDTDVQEPVIIHSCEDKPKFSDIMALETLRDLKGEDNLTKAYMFFKEALKNRKSLHNDLEVLLRMVNSKVKFVVISLSENDDEQQIFDTINSLGVPLTTGELMKNFLYGEADEEAYRTTWKIVFDTDEARAFWEADAAKTRQEKSKENTTIERFFHAFVRVKMWEFKDQLTDAQKRSFVKIGNVFATCKAFVEKFGMNKLDLANEIIMYAKLYREYLNESILDVRVPQHAGIKRISCFINASKNYVVIPYVLYILHVQQNEVERNQIFDYLESYLMRRVLADSKNGSYSEFFSESLISNGIATAKDLKDFISEKNAGSNLAMPSNSAIKLRLRTRTKAMDETMARIVYYLYETKLTSAKDEVFTGGYNNYYAELLMPKPSKSDNSNWPKHKENSQKEEERKQQIGTLGNLFLLDSNGKKELKKKSEEICSVKVNLMKKWSEGIRSNQIFNNLTSWTKEKIEDRNDGLSEVLSKNIWTV